MLAPFLPAELRVFPASSVVVVSSVDIGPLPSSMVEEVVSSVTEEVSGTVGCVVGAVVGAVVGMMVSAGLELRHPQPVNKATVRRSTKLSASAFFMRLPPCDLVDSEILLPSAVNLHREKYPKHK